MPEENTPLHGGLSFESLNLLKANLCARAKIKGHTTPTSNDLLKTCLKGFLRGRHQSIRRQRFQIKSDIMQILICPFYITSFQIHKYKFSVHFGRCALEFPNPNIMVDCVSSN